MHLDCWLKFHTVGFAQVDGDSEDRNHFSLVIAIQDPGQLLETALDCMPQCILHFLVNLLKCGSIIFSGTPHKKQEVDRA